MSELYRKIDLSSFSSWRKGFLLLIISFLTIPSVSAETIHTDKWIYPLLGFQITSDMVTMLMGIVILCIIFFIFWIFSYSKKVVGDLELFSHQQINVFGYFLKSIAVASGIVYLAVYLLQNDPNGVSKTLFFGILPYLATVLFLVGTIMRYRESGFKVSSLSSQFLEGRTLFWGTQPFHWGILVLFFGHLIAFLFPDTIIAWNQLTIRLLILEASAFAFGLLT
ncbi:MAG: respiratory nitrate reductase subunit gamma, partial [Cyclobacteriaceae bacterium]|nr:respiratory nitrate reductase subunit gamma [Cyclobacteriaceae bacterium]